MRIPQYRFVEDGVCEEQRRVTAVIRTLTSLWKRWSGLWSDGNASPPPFPVTSSSFQRRQADNRETLPPAAKMSKMGKVLAGTVLQGLVLQREG